MDTRETDRPGLADRAAPAAAGPSPSQAQDRRQLLGQAREIKRLRAALLAAEAQLCAAAQASAQLSQRLESQRTASEQRALQAEAAQVALQRRLSLLEQSRSFRVARLYVGLYRLPVLGRALAALRRIVASGLRTVRRRD